MPPEAKFLSLTLVHAGANPATVSYASLAAQIHDLRKRLEHLETQVRDLQSIHPGGNHKDPRSLTTADLYRAARRGDLGGRELERVLRGE
jgi:hypothetical protein